jgi:flagellar FliL protein
MSKTVLIIVALVLFLFMGMMGAGFFILWSKISAMPQNGPMYGQMPAEETESGMGPLYDLDTMIVNLADQGGKRYLRVTMALEVRDQDVVSNIDKRLPQVRDAVLSISADKKI